MIAFLTSSPGGNCIIDGTRHPANLDESNGFVSQLKNYWKENSEILIISAAPDEPEINDNMRNLFAQSFHMSGLPAGNVEICDSRNENLVHNINKYDVVILSGGHVPTQNSFFRKINLKEKIKKFDGILIGISAGTMNCAETVYAQPELEGESDDPEYQRFIPGLGITKFMILPHYQYIKDVILDGKRIIEDITYSDSIGRNFYALTDGSFIKIENQKTALYGEGYLITDGETKQICAENQSITLM